MAELADAPDLGSGGRPCRFKSCYPQGRERLFLALFFVLCRLLPTLPNLGWKMLVLPFTICYNYYRLRAFVP